MHQFTDVIANPPASIAEWDRIIRAEHSLHMRWPCRLRAMYRQYKAKAIVIEAKYQSHVDHPGYYKKLYMDNGMTSSEADAEVIVATAQHDHKRKRLNCFVRCCKVEHEIRLLLIKQGRHPKDSEGPPERNKEQEAELPFEEDIITSIDFSIKRNPI